MTIQRLLRQYAMLLFCVGITQIVFSQTKPISGKVTDDKGNPIQEASIIIKGGNVGTTSDASGLFKLNIPATAKTLVISSIGFESKEIEISDKTSFNISLESSENSLNQVVVIGYGTAKKKDITGSVSQISSKEFIAGNLSTPVQALQGKVPGLLITVPGGDPNGAPSINLRGQTSLSGAQQPLIVVDGVMLDDPSQFSNIPTADIERIDILKDASAAAIYGSRGSNGVMEVTLKKGAAGKPKIEYSGSVSIDKVAKLYNMANASEWKQGYSQLLIMQGKTQAYADSVINVSYNQGGNTDWQKALVRTGVSTNHDISISGGSKGFNYRGSINYNNQQGVVLNSNRNLLGLRFTAQQKALDDKLTLSASIVSSVTKRKLTDYNIFYEALSSPPVYPVNYDYVDFALQNPVKQQQQEIQNQTDRITLLNGTADYELTKGLSVGLRGGYTSYGQQFEFFQPKFPVVNNVNVAALATHQNVVQRGDAHINFSKYWGKNSLTAMAAYEYNQYNDNDFGAVSTNILVPALGSWYLNSVTQPYQHNYSNADEWRMISYLGRIQYNWDQRYYLTGTLRRDGSSKFGAGKRYGTFPALGASWRISREGFMQNLNWLDELKLNLGWGITGDQENIGPYTRYQLYNVSGAYYNAVTGVWNAAWSPYQNANLNLGWESKAMTNISLDFTLLQNRLSGNIGYYTSTTSNMLYVYGIAFPSPGAVVSTSLANVGEMTNKGIDFSINYKLINRKDFSWTIGGQISGVRTRIKSLSGSFNNGYTTYHINTNTIPQGVAEGRGLSSNPITYFQVGYTPWIFYMPHYLGLDKNGVETYDSAGGVTSNILNATNHYTDPAPKFNYGINSQIDYKRFGLNIFFRGVAGAKIFDNTRMVMDNINRFGGNNGTQEALTNGITNAPQASDHWLEKAGFLRLDNVVLSYTLPTAKVFQSLRFYIAANNLFVITKYRGLDPEIRTATGTSNVLRSTLSAANVANSFSQGGSTGTENYIDAAYSGDGYYPKTRSFTLGVNFTLR